MGMGLATVFLTFVSLIAGWIPGLKQKQDGGVTSRPTILGWVFIGLTLTGAVGVAFLTEREGRAKDRQNDQLVDSLDHAHRLINITNKQLENANHQIDRANEQLEASHQDLGNVNDKLVASQTNLQTVQTQLSAANVLIADVSGKAAGIQNDAGLIYAFNSELQIWRDMLEGAIEYIHIQAANQVWKLKQEVLYVQFSEQSFSMEEWWVSRSSLNENSLSAKDSFLKEYESTIRLMRHAHEQYKKTLEFFNCNMGETSGFSINLSKTEAEINAEIAELREKYKKSKMRHLQAEQLAGSVILDIERLHDSMRCIVKNEHARRLYALLPPSMRTNHKLLALKMEETPPWAADLSPAYSQPVSLKSPTPKQVATNKIEPLLPLPLKR